MFKWLILKKLKKLSRQIAQMGVEMSAALDRIKASVESMSNVTQGAVTLLGELSQRIRDLSDNPAQLEALADEIDQRKAELSNAITANTPSAEG